jgi:tRNA threonylcarbamoyladenosine biosynthesis protein TsaE
MKLFGRMIGELLVGGETIELVGDVGAGKTTLVKGIARGLGADDQVQSPSFTISRIYSGRDDLTLAHYDFYRLNDAGIMANELQEATGDNKTIVVIEWADVASGVLPSDRLTINISTPSETTRRLEIIASGKRSHQILEELRV